MAVWIRGGRQRAVQLADARVVPARPGARSRGREPGVPDLRDGGRSMIRRLMFGRSILSLAALIALFGLDRPLAAAPDVDARDACMADARARAAKAVANGATRYDARRQLESDVVRCQDPRIEKATAAFIGTINADLADFAQQFVLGQLDAIEYRNARLDRSRK